MTVTTVSPPKRRARTARLPVSHRSIVARGFRYLGALAVLATGVAHIEQYAVDNYSTVPTIGTLFLLNFIAAIVIAVGLIAPLRRATGRYTVLARAMIAKPAILLADEPTGNLDQKSGARVIELMFDMARQQGATVIFVTHDPGLAARADRMLTMTLGQLSETATGIVRNSVGRASNRSASLAACSGIRARPR